MTAEAAAGGDATHAEASQGMAAETATGEEERAAVAARAIKFKGRGRTRRGLYGDDSEQAPVPEAAYGWGAEDTAFAGVDSGLQSRLRAPASLASRLGDRKY